MLLSAGSRCQRAFGQLEQPRAHHGALLPEPGDFRQVELVVVGVEQLEALGVRLHQAVLDAVVDHLHVVPGPARTEVRVAALGSERGEQRLGVGERVLRSADHEAVPLLEAPDAAGDAAIEEAQSALLGLPGAADRVRVAAVAALDHEVARRQQTEQIGEGALGGLPGGEHQPDDARRIEGLDHRLQRVGVAQLGVEVVADDLVSGAAQAFADAAAHAPEAGEPDPHAPSSASSAGVTRATRRPSALTTVRSGSRPSRSRSRRG